MLSVFDPDRRPEAGSRSKFDHEQNFFLDRDPTLDSDPIKNLGSNQIWIVIQKKFLIAIKIFRLDRGSRSGSAY